MITRTFYTLFFSIVISDIIIYFTHINNLGHTLWRTLWFVPSILLIAGLVTVMFARKQFYMIDKAHIASFYFMLCLAITIPKCVFAVTYLTKYAVQQFTTADVDRIFTNIALGLGLATFAIIAIGTLWGWRKAVITRVTVSSSKLPDTFDGLKIVHISDIHASTWSRNWLISRSRSGHCVRNMASIPFSGITTTRPTIHGATSWIRNGISRT